MIKIHGTAMQHITRDPKHNIKDSRHLYNVVGNVSSACPKSLLNLFKIRPNGFCTKNVNGERTTLVKARLCMEVDACNAAWKNNTALKNDNTTTKSRPFCSYGKW